MFWLASDFKTFADIDVTSSIDMAKLYPVTLPGAYYTTPDEVLAAMKKAIARITETLFGSAHMTQFTSSMAATLPPFLINGPETGLYFPPQSLMHRIFGLPDDRPYVDPSETLPYITNTLAVCGDTMRVQLPTLMMEGPQNGFTTDIAEIAICDTNMAYGDTAVLNMAQTNPYEVGEHEGYTQALEVKVVNNDGRPFDAQYGSFRLELQILQPDAVSKGTTIRPLALEDPEIQDRYMS